MTKIKDLLKKKSIQGVLSIGPDATIPEAIHLLSHHNVGALLVLDRGSLVGFISERDLLRSANAFGLLQLQEKIVSEVMTRDVIIGLPEDDVAYVASIMINSKVRHLPILHGKEIVGLISIGDVVHAQISDHKFENKMLNDYIQGTYPG